MSLTQCTLAKGQITRSHFHNWTLKVQNCQFPAGVKLRRGWELWMAGMPSHTTKGTPTPIRPFRLFDVKLLPPKLRQTFKLTYQRIYSLMSEAQGLTFRTNDLNAADYTKDVPSIQALLNRTGLSIPEILSGDQSFGAMFEAEGYETIPSPRQPIPGKDKYYRGGHITQIHGSRDGGLVDAIQTEFPKTIRRDEQIRNDFIKALARTVAKFHKIYYTV